MPDDEFGDESGQCAQDSDASDRPYVLRLYVAGLSARSARAIEDVRGFCEQELKDAYRLEVVDISQYPELARDEQIIVAPTLVRRLPLPLRRLIGDLSDRQRVLKALDVHPME